MSDHCENCGCKNHLRASYCNNCGKSLSYNRARKDAKGRMKLHADIAHPINTHCREKIQQAVINAYEQEVEDSKKEGYQPVAWDDDEDDDDIPEVI